MNAHGPAAHAIVDGKRKSPGEKPVVAKVLRVDAGENPEGVDVGEEGVEEVVPQPPALAFVEPEAIEEVFLGVVQDLDSHLARRRILRLARAQSVNRDAPC
jgi:hypothetical protein